jgi:hypothetical protein
VETSSSVKSAELRQMKDFMIRIVNGLVISRSKIQVAVVSYGNQANILFHLNTHSNKIDVVSDINSMTSTGGSTATSTAIRLTKDDVFGANNGARVGAAHVAILITKSLPDSKTATELVSALLTKSETTLFTVTVGSAFNSSDLLKISSQPNCAHHHHINHFSDLADFAVEMNEAICQGKSYMIR